VSNLSESIAERQRQQALQRLTPLGVSVDIEIQRLPSPGQGTMLLLLAEFANSRCCVYGLGARGKPAERVADEAVDELEMFLGTEAAIDPYLADQLLLPLACSAGVSELTTSRVSQHLVTNADVIRLFLPVEIVIEGDIGHPGRVRLAGQG
jgi:RNA 3'-terminal phosphate cyclase (ATP)